MLKFMQNSGLATLLYFAALLSATSLLANGLRFDREAGLHVLLIVAAVLTWACTTAKPSREKGDENAN